MRFIVDEVPTDPKKCPFYTQEVHFKTLETLDVCHFNRAHGNYCRLCYDNGKCTYFVSYQDFINEQIKQCSGQMEAHAHDT